ncbi:hypothetical protein TrCOL_g5027 [Triparma columacea]|uniref:Uncharacterized protein n=1 Tax=Triparma columacea TaxID=722753 RepID=A0A9W7GBJ2_9STRA|nr:hypothetical protein TrCOL_g5027 [Triparma columacea]
MLRTSYLSTLRSVSSSSSSPSPDDGLPPSSSTTSSSSSSSNPLYLRQSDIVSYYTLDGGSPTGKINVGVAVTAFLAGPNTATWMVEVRPLEDYSEESKPGYYRELTRRNRGRNEVVDMKDLRKEVGSYVRAVDAFKVAVDRDGLPLGLKEDRVYDQEGFEGIVRPKSNIVIDEAVNEEDGRKYKDLKNRILLDALALGGTAALAVGVVDRELASDYLLGLASGIIYVGLLSISTDTMGGPSATPGDALGMLRKNLPPLRLLAPALALGVVAVDNYVKGNPLIQPGNLLHTVTPSQFAATMGGFVTYRLPIVFREVGGAIGEELGIEGASLLPGSVGVAVEIGREGIRGMGGEGMGEEGMGGEGKKENVVVVVSGARGYVDPLMVSDAVVASSSSTVFLPPLVSPGDPGYEEGGVVGVQGGGRGWRREDMEREGVKVVVADVEGVESLRRSFDGVMVGVWCSDTTLDKIRDRVKANCERRGEEPPGDETLVADIEYGIVSGVFEFTILGEGEGEGRGGVEELGKALEYAINISEGVQ